MNHKSSFYADLFRRIFSGMMAWPSKLSVMERATPNKIIVGVQCHGDDHGQIIGKEAGHIQALQAIFQAIGMVRGEKVEISVGESVTKPTGCRPNVVSDPNWNDDNDLALSTLVRDILSPMMRKQFGISSVPAGNLTILVVKLNEPISQPVFDAVTKIVAAWGIVNGRKVQMQLSNDPKNP